MNIYQSLVGSYKRRFCRFALTLLLAGLCQSAANASSASMEPPTTTNLSATSEDDTTYHLTVGANPKIAGSVSASAEDVQAGKEIRLRTDNNKGFVFKNWTIDGKEVSISPDFDYVMPDHDVTIIANYYYSPEGPGDPQTPVYEDLYHITVVANPAIAGSVYASSNSLKAEEVASLRASANSGFVFKNWTIEGREVSTEKQFDYEMPNYDVTIVANYVYNPESPGNPEIEEEKVMHPVVLRSIPSIAASFRPSSSFDMEENTSGTIQARPNTGWELIRWTVNGEEQPTKDLSLEINVGEEALDIAAYFTYNPSSPQNPAANSFDPSTGEMVVDDFAPGNMYNTVCNLRGSWNNEDITNLILKGQMNSGDIGCLGYLREIGGIDLSRTSGIDAISGGTFLGWQASHILLPATVGSIDDYAFDGCENLTDLTIYAQVPPTCSEETFGNFPNKDNCTVYVPASAIELYTNAEYWKDFTILPITKNVHVLQVNLPDDAAEGYYKNNSLELVNTKSGVRQKYVVTDRMLYTFNGLQKDEIYNVYMYSKTGLEIGRIENVVIPETDIEVTFDDLKSLHTVSAKVLASDGSDVTSQTSVEWLKPLADGTSVYLRKTAILDEIPEGQQLICRVSLDAKLGVVYADPQDVKYTVVDGDNTCTVNLAPFRSIALSGTVVDADSAALAGAMVSVNQTLNGKYSKTYSAKTDANGQWKISVLDAPETRFIYAASECINVNDTIGAFDADVNTLDLGKAVLKSIAGARVTYGFTYRDAGADKTEDNYADYQNVVISVFNVTQNRDHKDVSLQYPVLAVLDENINAGDVLKLTATSKKGAFNPVERTVTVGENQRAEVTFDIVGKGGIAASVEIVEGQVVIAMLYSPKGELLKKQTYSDAKTAFTGLEDGDYTLITMQQSDLMNAVLRLSSFSEIGLAEGKDYVKNAVKVESGKLSEIKISEVPTFDESVLYYTNSSTSFSANKSSLTTGNYLTLRSAIDFKDDYKNDIDNVTLIVDLPDACELVEESVIQGPNLLPYTIDNNRLTVQLGKNYQSQTRFCVIPTSGGSFNASASILFDYNGKTLTQPIGSATTEIKDIEIMVPQSTVRGKFIVSGNSSQKTAVNIYVDGVIASHTDTNNSGDWSAECEIDNPENFSVHYVYAEFNTPGGTKILSETKEITVNPMDVEVDNVEMTFYNGYYNKQYSVIWDFKSGTVNTNKYDFYTTTDMTFIIDLKYRDLKLIPLVWLHVYTSDGNVRSLRADYDKTKDKWVAVDKFSSSALPTRVSLSIENMMFDIASEVDYNLLIDQYIGDIELKDVVENEGGATYSYVDGNGEDLAEVSSLKSNKSVEEISEELLSQGFTEEKILDETSDYVPEDEEDVVGMDIKMFSQPETGSFSFVIPGSAGTQVLYIRLVKEENKTSSTQLVSSTVSRQWRNFLRTYFDKQACVEVTEYERHTEYLDKYVTVITSALVAHTIFVNTDLLPPNTYIPGKQVLAFLRRVRHYSKRHTTSTMEFSVLPKICNPKPPKPAPSPVPPTNPIMDPSGYVYEAVPTNRVEGVQASIYHWKKVEDNYGDSIVELTLWDAEKYAQKNPLFTDKNGMYKWDVPQDVWRVKFEKDGYITTYSPWLPVPPPQLDVNIEIKQNKQPEVRSVHAYEEGVEVQFDKYMNPSTMTTDKIFVTANGEKLNGEIRLIASELADESDSKEDAKRYASRVRFVPETKLDATTGEIRLTVSREVESYAGIPMTSTYSQVLDVEKEVKVLFADDVKVLYGGEKEVIVYAVPAEAAVGRKLRMDNSSDLIATIDITEATLDADGKAVVKIKGELPGSAMLSFMIDDAAVTGECVVDVLKDMVTAEAPQASRVSGSAVYRGTTVELTTDTENGTIYYTTDGSCPCDENGTRSVYTEPIVINDDMQILAMTSVFDKDEEIVSETVELEYTLKRSDMDFQMAEGWTWVSHNFERNLTPDEISADENVSRILSQTDEVIRDPEVGMIGTLKDMSASESYKVEASATTERKRISDIAWNPATPVAISSGWNWLGYPVPQTMSVNEAFATTEAETRDIVVGQNGFAQFDGESWIGTLEVMSPGMGYMYNSQSAKDVVYNTSIVSMASAKHVAGISKKSSLVLDIHKYGNIMPVVATINDCDGSQLDNHDYQVAAFCGTECRGIGKVVKGLVMMNVYGNINDQITFRVTDTDEQLSFTNDASLKFGETVVGNIFEPYVVTINDKSGIESVTYDGNIKVWVEGDMLRIKGIAADDIDLVEIYDINGQKLIRETSVSESGIRISTLNSGVYVVIVNGKGEYTYHKIALSK